MILFIAKEEAIKDSLNACLAVNECRSMYENDKFFKRLKEEIQNAIRERSKKGGIVKNKNSNEIKKQILGRYNVEAKRYKELGKVLSKNKFSREMAQEYNISETTIRNNWLKGYNPKI